MIPELDPSHGLLPPGRYRASQDDVYARFVDDRSPRRLELWRDWQMATNLLRRHVHVNAAWLYGQFCSDDPDPPVVSCVYWAEDLEMEKARLNPASTNTLQAFTKRGRVRATLGVQVDTQLMAWHCQPDISNEDHYLPGYLQQRGQVDDYLQRIRSGPKGSQPERDHALPRKGYLEVIVDDYQ